MVKAHFLMTFHKSSGEIAEAKVDSTYFLFMKGETPKIVMHMEHEDLKEAMQARRILSEKDLTFSHRLPAAQGGSFLLLLLKPQKRAVEYTIRHG